MHTIKSLFLAMGVLALVACGSSNDDNSTSTTGPSASNVNANIPTASMKYIGDLEFPKVKGGNSIIISHLDGDSLNYSIEWDTEKKSNRWSCYKMYWSNRLSRTKRYSDSPQYPSDPDMNSSYQYSVDNDPFGDIKYDHGHLCPSADRLNSANSNYQTFYLTNMQPQAHSFNAGIWRDMETLIRSWITVNSSHSDTLYVCKGGTIDKSTDIFTTTSKGLLVPRYYFSAVLMKNSSGYKAIGFWFDQTVSASKQGTLASHVVNIDTLEEKTGIDFFCNLPDDTEEHVESLAVENILRAWKLN